MGAWIRRLRRAGGDPAWALRALADRLDPPRATRPADTPRPVLAPQGDRFERAVFAKYGVHGIEDVTDPTVRLWVDFALSTVERGRESLAALGPQVDVAGRRVLDVGCAYGGFLVAAIEAGASEAVGIEIDPDLARMGESLAADYDLDLDIRIGDLENEEVVRSLGWFDVILCSDVLEHVQDPEVSIGHLQRLMDVDATLFVQVPNGRSLDYAVKDGHYGLAGLTLLDRADAERWWHVAYQVPFAAKGYGVEHYAPLSAYLAMFARRGIALRLVNVPEVDDPDAVVEGIAAKAAAVSAMSDSLEPPSEDLIDLAAALRQRAGELVADVHAELGRFRRSANEVERRLIATRLAVEYGMDTWQFVANRQW